MGKSHNRFVGKAEAQKGWRIWDNKMKRWWGERYTRYPQELLDELNAPKRPERLTELIKKMKCKRT